MDDWLFALLPLAAVLGGAIRSSRSRSKRQSRIPPLPELGAAVETRGVYTMPYFRMFRFVLLVPAVFVLAALAAGEADQVWGLVLISVPIGIAGWRLSKVGVFVDPGGLRIVNFSSTRRVTWSEIDRFEPRDYPENAKAVLTTGDTFGVTALAMGNPLLKEDKSVLRIIAELNHLLAQKSAQVASPRT